MLAYAPELRKLGYRVPAPKANRHCLSLSFVGPMAAGRSAISQPIEMAERPIGVPPYAGFVAGFVGRMPARRSAISQPIEMAEPPTEFRPTRATRALAEPKPWPPR
jgi:hypothetical protein